MRLASSGRHNEDIHDMVVFFVHVVADESDPFSVRRPTGKSGLTFPRIFWVPRKTCYLCRFSPLDGNRVNVDFNMRIFIIPLGNISGARKHELFSIR